MSRSAIVRVTLLLHAHVWVPCSHFSFPISIPQTCFFLLSFELKLNKAMLTPTLVVEGDFGRLGSDGERWGGQCNRNPETRQKLCDTSQWYCAAVD